MRLIAQRLKCTHLGQSELINLILVLGILGPEWTMPAEKWWLGLLQKPNKHCIAGVWTKVVPIQKIFF